MALVIVGNIIYCWIFHYFLFTGSQSQSSRRL